MNGKDIFLGLRHIDDDIIEEAEFGTFPIKQLHRTIRRPLLVAAVIALTLLLVGCAVVYVLCMQDLKVGQQEVVEFVYEVDPDTKQVVDDLVQKPVTKQVLTLAGLKGTPNYQAAREWFDFKQNYVPQGEILKFPEEYASYSISTQEMKDKLDGILQKYDLKLIGKTLPFTTEEQVCKAVGLETIALQEAGANMVVDYAAYQECGNFNMDFNFMLPATGEIPAMETQCHIYYMHKEAFTESAIEISQIDTWKEWNYTTASGAEVLIFRSPNDWRGFIFCDMPNYTVTLRFTFINEQFVTDKNGITVHEQEFMSDQQMERLADAIDFSKEPKLIENWEEITSLAADQGEAINGYSIKLKSVESDGRKAVITLGFTAPEGVNLLEQNGYPVGLKPSNRWGLFEDVSGKIESLPGGYGPEEDGDGKANTQDVVLRYSAGEEQLRNGVLPFAKGETWRIHWQDIYAKYWNSKTDEQEEILLAEGTWSFDVEFADVNIEELELITEPITAKVAYEWDISGKELYRDTNITSFVLRSMSASIVCDMESAPDFLAMGDRCAYVTLKDGSRIALRSDNASIGIQNLQPESKIHLDQVVSVLMPDGTEIKVPGE